VTALHDPLHVFDDGFIVDEWHPTRGW
jgi:hypothetical protein